MRLHRVLLTACMALALGAAAPPAARAAPPGALAAVQSLGPPELVFDAAAQSCGAQDIPDMMARAFRDNHGEVHLFASSGISHPMLGAELGSVQHSCETAFNSVKDPNPADFAYADWLGAFFTLDGQHVMALVHNEFHGWQVPGMCVQPRQGGPKGHCWWNSVDFAESSDGGVSFTMPPAPGNLIAAPSIPYDPDNSDGAVGYFQPTNIVSYQGAYYFMMNTWRYLAQKPGACLMRSTTPFDPASWRAWDGSGFTVKFPDPYLAGTDAAGQITCAPVYRGLAQGLVYDPAHKMFLVSDYRQGSAAAPAGMYISASPDLVHWARPVLAVSQAALAGYDGPGRRRYDYASLLDPASTDMDFATVSDTCYAYYVRTNIIQPKQTRQLFRIKIQLAFTGAP